MRPSPSVALVEWALVRQRFSKARLGLAPLIYNAADSRNTSVLASPRIARIDRVTL